MALSKEDFKGKVSALEDRLRVLQQECREAKIPVIIVVEGWDAAGKGPAISTFIERLDPRGYKVYPTYAPNIEEAMRPFLWRFWLQMPGNGQIAIFDRSYYGRVLVERVDKLCSKKEWMRGYDEINQFERNLYDAGNVILKFFMHISKKEQKKRLSKMEADKYQKWKVEKKDWENNKRYDEWVKVYDEMFERTSTTYAPWVVLEAEDSKYARIKMLETAIKVLEQKLKEVGEKVVRPANVIALSSNPQTVLDQVDISLKLEREEYKKELSKYQAKLHDLSFKLFEKRVPCIIGYEGWDAGGKGGNIRRLIAPLDPRGYSVIPIAAPQGDERTHHYLWRFWKHFPKAGHIAIFDRTWYGRVLVERVEGFCREDEWQRAYQEINEFEAQMASFGTIICKFWIHISKEEQLRRFEERQKTDYKRYKITEEDWRNREKWDTYEAAVGEMLLRTSTTYAPWTIVEGNDKLWARIRVLKTACEALAKGLKRR